MKSSRLCRIKRDFDAWAYSINWPQTSASLPLLGFASLTVEDIKFAYNAWCFLRLAMFYGTEQPKVLSKLVGCTPSMDIIHGGNRLFYMHAQVGGQLSVNKVKVALTPCHNDARPIQAFRWIDAAYRGGWGLSDVGENRGVEIVLGMENGMSEEVRSQCDHFLYISQYGSMGSLSMMSAMAIAVHLAFSARWGGSGSLDYFTPKKGHMPLSSDSSATLTPHALPHEKDLVHMSNADIKAVLAQRRSFYKLQLSVMVHNEFGDRNIGAIMRNANVFNCEEMIVLNRRKFNRRGAVGTQHLLTTTCHATLSDADCQARLQGYVLWLLHQYYPYLKIHAVPSHDSDATFLRHDDAHLQWWLKNRVHCLYKAHPASNDSESHCPQSSRASEDDWARLCEDEIFLDDEHSIMKAVKDTATHGYRGIMLVIPEEGTSPPIELVKCAQRLVHVVHPSRLAHEVQRGLNGALASAIALERLRTAIDNL
uniref:Uncharacterized protein TCIL3000_1_2000 n=1 Tax=Trypanosoma congolense (strain IL3000) TaxID=1068625 RepID=G0UJ82_TRYCI|nr:unnamed protein product [Trypanosoma congolense IL3000]